MVVIFCLGILAGILAPLLRRFGKAGGVALAAGAATLIVVAGLGLLNPDMRQGMATVEANRRQYSLVLAWELPVLVLALVSLQRLKKLFWLGWAIHAAFTVLIAVIVIWLEFFWHW
jgi:hypothetical protein